MKHRLISMILVCFIAGSALADELIMDAPLVDEISRLEVLHQEKRATGEDLIELGELYFLSSRCSELPGLLTRKAPAEKGRAFELLCACGYLCDDQRMARTDLAKLHRFQTELARLGRGQAKWTDHRVQAAWKTVAEMPEAWYWAVRRLRASPKLMREPKSVRLAAELEKQLAGLEVDHAD